MEQLQIGQPKKQDVSKDKSIDLHGLSLKRTRMEQLQIGQPKNKMYLKTKVLICMG